MGDFVSPATHSMQQRMPSSLGKVVDEPLASVGSGDGLRSPSLGSETPEPDLDNDIDLPDQDLDQDGDKDAKPQQEQQAPPQKRKGGRKPIYATSEERKQRNRQAQAAFRERRTEYIKQLESTIKTHEETLASLQASHRNAADECLMLRYKNSLLERILIEKGIDVQGELRAKTGSPNVMPTRAPVPTPNSAPAAAANMNRFPVNKFQGRRPLSISAKSDSNPIEPAIMQTRSPLAQATVTSHLPSPIAPMARSPNFVPQTGAMSPSLGTPMSQQPLRPQQPIRPQQFAQTPRSSFQQNTMQATQSPVAAPMSNGQNRDSQGFFVSPFQNHYDQLDQEYDAQADMVDEHDHADGHPYQQQNAYNPNIPQQGGGIPPQSGVNPNTGSMPQQPDGSAPHLNGLPPAFDPQDPMLDADPFGLSASMYFPTPYSFEAPR